MRCVNDRTTEQPNNRTTFGQAAAAAAAITLQIVISMIISGTCLVIGHMHAAVAGRIAVDHFMRVLVKQSPEGRHLSQGPECPEEVGTHSMVSVALHHNILRYRVGSLTHETILCIASETGAVC